MPYSGNNPEGKFRLVSEFELLNLNPQGISPQQLML
jgi:hypothetical protein